MSNSKPDKREPDPLPEQRSAKAPRIRNRSQDTPRPAFASASSSDFLDAPESLHIPYDSIVRTASSSVAANTPQAAPPIAESASASAPTDPPFHLPQPHATATLPTGASNRDWQEKLVHRAQQPQLWSGGVPPVDTPALHSLPLSQASNAVAVPLAATIENLGPAPLVPDQTSTRIFSIELNSSPPPGAAVQIGTQTPNGQAQPPTVTRQTPGPGRRICKCACTRKDTCVLHKCCIFGVRLTKAERDVLANAANPQLRVKATENSFKTTAWKPSQIAAENAVRTPPPHAGSTAVVSEARNATANAAPVAARDPARTSFPPADRNQRHVPRVRYPRPVPQHPAIPSVGQAAHVHPSNLVLDTEAMATLMNQFRDGFATLQAIPSSIHNAKVSEAVIASLQGSFQNFVSTVVRQRDLDWQTTMDEHNKRVQAERLAWHTSLKNMGAQSRKMINERDGRITHPEKQIERLKNGTADPGNQLLGLQMNMEQRHQEHLMEYNWLKGSLGDTPESMTQDILRSRGLLPPDQDNRRSTVHQGHRLPEANRQPALPRPHYVSTAEANARMAAMCPDQESENGEDDDEDDDDNDEPEVQKRSETSRESENVVSPMEKGDNMDVDSK